MQGIALVILTIVVVQVLWRLTGEEPVQAGVEELGNMLVNMRQSVQLLNDSYQSGLRRVYAASGSAGSNEDWMKRLRSSTKEVDLMGYTLHVWTRGAHFEDVILRLAQAGVHMRIVIMDEHNPHLNAFINHRQIPGLTVDSVKSELQAARDAFKTIFATTLARVPEASLELRVLKEGIIAAQIVRTDSRLTAVQYLYSSVASRSPMLDVSEENSTLFCCYKEEFESVWQLAVAA